MENKEQKLNKRFCWLLVKSYIQRILCKTTRSNEYKRQTLPKTSFLRQLALPAPVTSFKCNYLIIPKCRMTRSKNPNQYIDTIGKVSLMTEQCNSIKDKPKTYIL